MKFPIAFLSLLTTAAYAQHEPKSLRGSVEDFDFLEVENNVVTIPPGSKATIRNCGPSDQCCLQDGSHCARIENTGSMNFGGAICLSEGTVEGAGNCVLSCSGTCNPALAATGGGGTPSSSVGGGGGYGWPSNNGRGWPSNNGGGYGWPPSNGGGWPYNSSGRTAGYGCAYMPRFVCTKNPLCTIDQNNNCVARVPYEELDEEVDYDSSFDEEDEDAYAMAAEE